jgi:hypothetical protein
MFDHNNAHVNDLLARHLYNLQAVCGPARPAPPMHVVSKSPSRPGVLRAVVTASPGLACERKGLCDRGFVVR